MKWMLVVEFGSGYGFKVCKLNRFYNVGLWRNAKDMIDCIDYVGFAGEMGLNGRFDSENADPRSHRHAVPILRPWTTFTEKTVFQVQVPN